MENKEKTFRETLESMSAKELILLMIDSVENPVTKLDMDSYGKIIGGTCYGCAATNTVLKLAKGKLKPEVLCGRNLESSGRYLAVDSGVLSVFESAINSLRCGDIESYDEIRLDFILYKEEGLRLPEITRCGMTLPAIQNDYTKEDLDAYRKLAELQEN